MTTHPPRRHPLAVVVGAAFAVAAVLATAAPAAETSRLTAKDAVTTLAFQPQWLGLAGLEVRAPRSTVPPAPAHPLSLAPRDGALSFASPSPWALELEAPVDVAALLRPDEGLDGAEARAAEALNVLEGGPAEPGFRRESGGGDEGEVAELPVRVEGVGQRVGVALGDTQLGVPHEVADAFEGHPLILQERGEHSTQRVPAYTREARCFEPVLEDAPHGSPVAESAGRVGEDVVELLPCLAGEEPIASFLLPTQLKGVERQVCEGDGALSASGLGAG